MSFSGKASSEVPNINEGRTLRSSTRKQTELSKSTITFLASRGRKQKSNPRKEKEASPKTTLSSEKAQEKNAREDVNEKQQEKPSEKVDPASDDGISTEEETANPETSTAQSTNVMSKTAVKNLFHRMDPSTEPDEDVQGLLSQYSEDFLDQVIEGACIIAIERQSTKVETCDVKLFLERKFNKMLRVRQLPKDQEMPTLAVSDALEHQQQMALVKGDINI